MAFIGNTPTTQAFTPAVDYFSGNGSTTAFTLSRPVASVAQVQVVIDNVAQNPSSAYTVSSNTITFTSAPLSGTNNIYVYYTSPITQVIAPGQNTVNTNSLSASLLVPPAMVSDQANTSTGYFAVPTGTTAQRPGSPTNGMVRMNTTTGYPEWYSSAAGSWVQFNSTPTTSLDLLVVAGGGGGGGDNTYGGGNWKGGGGGAGGYLEQTGRTISLGTAYTVTVGAGGTAGASNSGNGGAGNNSVFGTSTALGGGYGAGSGGSGSATSGGSGGSGGGGGGAQNGSASGGAATQGTSGGATGYGFAGGGSGYATAGGGGGAGGTGTSNVNSGGSGAGKVSTITGSSVTYAAGGAVGAAVVGTANTGNGGSGAVGNGIAGYAGGSGVVVLKYLATLTATYSGGVTRTSVTSGGYKIDTITATSTTSETVTFN
jgi:hypothetical protein